MESDRYSGIVSGTKRPPSIERVMYAVRAITTKESQTELNFRVFLCFCSRNQQL